MRLSLLIGVVVVCAGCASTRPAGARAEAVPDPRPDPASTLWRSVVGCYRVDGGQVLLDSVPDLKLNADRPAVRRALFSPEPAIVGGYWYVTAEGEVWVFRHDGLWGRSWELAVRGDSLVGRGWLRTDVPGQRHEPEPAVAVRVDGCEVDRSVAGKPFRGGSHVAGLENLALDRLPPAGAFLVALPMKVAGGSGGPVRVVSFVPARAP